MTPKSPTSSVEDLEKDCNDGNVTCKTDLSDTAKRISPSRTKTITRTEAEDAEVEVGTLADDINNSIRNRR
jgi:hypothetical protein